MHHALSVLDFASVRTRLAFHCETSLGESLAQGILPSFDEQTVWWEQGRTKEGHVLLSEVNTPALSSIRDLRKSLTLAAKGGLMNGAELYQVGEMLAAFRNFKSTVSNRRSSCPQLWQLVEQFPDLKRVEDELHSKLDGSGEVQDSASVELGQLRRKKRSAMSKIVERIQAYTSGKNRDLLSDPIYTQRDGRYVVPVKVENRGKVRGIVHDTSGSGQTLFI